MGIDAVPDGSDRSSRQRQLRAWIEETRRNQRRLAIGLAAAAPATAALLVWREPVGAVALVSAIAVAICGFWILAAHQATHRQKLEELAAAERDPGGRRG
jgi:hypothetical protein